MGGHSSWQRALCVVLTSEIVTAGAGTRSLLESLSDSSTGYNNLLLISFRNALFIPAVVFVLFLLLCLFLVIGEVYFHEEVDNSYRKEHYLVLRKVKASINNAGDIEDPRRPRLPRSTCCGQSDRYRNDEDVVLLGRKRTSRLVPAKALSSRSTGQNSSLSENRTSMDEVYGSPGTDIAITDNKVRTSLSYRKFGPENGFIQMADVSSSSMAIICSPSTDASIFDEDGISSLSDCLDSEEESSILEAERELLCQAGIVKEHDYTEDVVVSSHEPRNEARDIRPKRLSKSDAVKARPSMSAGFTGNVNLKPARRSFVGTPHKDEQSIDDDVSPVNSQRIPSAYLNMSTGSGENMALIASILSASTEDYKQEKSGEGDVSLQIESPTVDEAEEAAHKADIDADLVLVVDEVKEEAHKADIDADLVLAVTTPAQGVSIDANVAVADSSSIRNLLQKVDDAPKLETPRKNSDVEKGPELLVAPVKDDPDLSPVAAVAADSPLLSANFAARKARPSLSLGFKGNIALSGSRRSVVKRPEPKEDLTPNNIPEASAGEIACAANDSQISQVKKISDNESDIDSVISKPHLDDVMETHPPPEKVQLSSEIEFESAVRAELTSTEEKFRTANEGSAADNASAATGPVTADIILNTDKNDSKIDEYDVGSTPAASSPATTTPTRSSWRRSSMTIGVNPALSPANASRANAWRNPISPGGTPRRAPPSSPHGPPKLPPASPSSWRRPSIDSPDSVPTGISRRSNTNRTSTEGVAGAVKSSSVPSRRPPQPVSAAAPVIAATAQSIPLDAAKHEDKMTADGFFAIESLRKGTPNGVDPRAKENYLSDSDFESIFHMSKAAFGVLPKWKQTTMKKDSGLY